MSISFLVEIICMILLYLRVITSESYLYWSWCVMLFTDRCTEYWFVGWVVQSVADLIGIRQLNILYIITAFSLLLFQLVVFFYLCVQ